MFRRNPNDLARRERTAALLAEATTPGPAVGDVVRVRRDNGTVDVVRVVDAYTAGASGIPMLTVRHAPRGIQTFTVRTDAVIPDGDGEAEGPHAATECWPPCPAHRADAEATAAAWRDNEEDPW